MLISIQLCLKSVWGTQDSDFIDTQSLTPEQDFHASGTRKNSPFNREKP